MLSWIGPRHAISCFRRAALFCCLGLIVLLESCDQFETREVFASVLAVEGKAGIIHERSAAPVSPSTLLAVGDRLRTEGSGQVIISLVPGARVVVSADSELEVEELQIHKLGAAISHAVRARNARIRLFRGSVYASVVAGEVRPHIRLYVETPAGAFEASPGSVFYLRVKETTTYVACAGGTVSRLSEDGQKAEAFDAGYAREWNKEKPTGLPKEASSDLGAAKEVQNALAVAGVAEALESSRRYIIPGLADREKGPKN